jgi:hypothetical protein
MNLRDICLVLPIGITFFLLLTVIGKGQPDGSSLDNVSTPIRKVYVNVGGKIFITKSTTLMKSGYFSALLEDEKYGENEKDTPFIDRDEEVFSSVLDILRNDCRIFSFPSRRLLYELHYFMVDIEYPYSLKKFIEFQKFYIRELSIEIWKILERKLKEMYHPIIDYEGLNLDLDHNRYSNLPNTLTRNAKEEIAITNILREIPRFLRGSAPYFGWDNEPGTSVYHRK